MAVGEEKLLRPNFPLAALRKIAERSRRHICGLRHASGAWESAPLRSAPLPGLRTRNGVSKHALIVLGLTPPFCGFTGPTMTNAQNMEYDDGWFDLNRDLNCMGGEYIAPKHLFPPCPS